MPAANAVITVKYEITTSNPDKEKPCHLNKVLGRNKLSFLSTADIHSLCFFGLIPPWVSIRRLKQTKFAPFYLTDKFFTECNVYCVYQTYALFTVALASDRIKSKNPPYSEVVMKTRRCP